MPEPGRDRIQALCRWLALQAPLRPLASLLPGQEEAASHFDACLGVRRGPDLHVHAFLHGLPGGEAALRAERLRRSLQLAEAQVPGRIQAAVWLLAEGRDSPSSAAREFLDFEDAHFLAKTLVSRGVLSPQGGGPLYAGRAQVLPDAAALARAAADPASDPGEAAERALAEREAEEARRRREAAQVQRLLKPGPTPATWTLLALNLLVFGLQVALAQSLRLPKDMSPDEAALLLLGANLPLLSLHGQPWRLLSYAFLHAGVLHLALNMLSLFAVGRVLERLVGPWRLLSLYLLAALAAGGLSAAWNPPKQLAVGASGAILGLAGVLLAPRWRRDPRLPEPLARQLFAWLARPVGLTLGLGLALSLLDGGLQFDNAGHLGGLLAGFTLGYLLPSFLVRPKRPSA